MLATVRTRWSRRSTPSLDEVMEWAYSGTLFPSEIHDLREIAPCSGGQWSFPHQSAKQCRERGTVLWPQLRFELEIATMDIAPAPGLAALEGGDHRVARRVEMLESVCVR